MVKTRTFSTMGYCPRVFIVNIAFLETWRDLLRFLRPLIDLSGTGGYLNTGFGSSGVFLCPGVFVCFWLYFDTPGYVCDVWVHLDAFGYN